MQVLGDAGKPPDKFSHMAVYGWIAPLVNASMPDNEWNTMEGTIVANKISVTLNGQKVHDNTMLEAHDHQCRGPERAGARSDSAGRERRQDLVSAGSR